MNRTLDITNLPVNTAQCSTCPFSSNDRTLQTKVIERGLIQQTSQICHSTEGPNREPRSLCRGMRDVKIQIFYRMGFLEAETDEAWEEARSRMVLNRGFH